MYTHFHFWALLFFCEFNFGFGLWFYFINLFEGLEWADSIFLFQAWLELGLVKNFWTELCKFWVTIGY